MAAQALSQTAKSGRCEVSLASSSFEKKNLPNLVDRPGSTQTGRGVVITGGTKGLGFAMACEFVQAGDRVVICSRSQQQVDVAVAALRELAGRCPGWKGSQATAASGCVCDVGRYEDIEALGKFAKDKLNVIDIWINNAGQVTSRSILADVLPADIMSAIAANVTGSILGSREAVRLMMLQPAIAGTTPGQVVPHPPYRIFNMGFSKWGAAFTQSSATHKSTKMALTQLTVSLTDELTKAGISSIAVHNLSPGMVLTDLLLNGTTPAARRFFNALAEEPETVAAELVPRIRGMDPSQPSGTSIDYLTPPEAVFRVLTRLPQIINGGRFFDKDGNRQRVAGQRYLANGVRIQLPDTSFLASSENQKEELSI